MRVFGEKMKNTMQEKNVDEGKMRGYNDLAIAIIKQAAKDYKAIYRAIMAGEMDELRLKAITEQKEKIEAFFGSEWFQILTNTDGKQILNKIKERLKKESKQ